PGAAETLRGRGISLAELLEQLRLLLRRYANAGVDAGYELRLVLASNFGTDGFCSPHASGGASMGAIWPCHLISEREGNHLTLRPAMNDRHVDTDLVLKAAHKEVT